MSLETVNYDNISYETLNYELENEIAVITLNRPHRLNAISEQLWKELSISIKQAEHQARVLIVTGGTKCFCAGADLKERSKSNYNSTYESYKFSQSIQSIIGSLDTLRIPVIAAMSGVAMGGGCEIGLACDFRIASNTLRLALPEVRIGSLPAAGGTQRLAKLIGIAKAKELLLLGEEVNAEKALNYYGLISKICEPDQLLAEAKKIAEKMLNYPPIGLMMIKKVVNLSVDTPIDIGLDLESFACSLLSATKDREEGLKAFVEKRKPKYEGR